CSLTERLRDREINKRTTEEQQNGDALLPLRAILPPGGGPPTPYCAVQAVGLTAQPWRCRRRTTLEHRHLLPARMTTGRGSRRQASGRGRGPWWLDDLC